MKFFDESKLNLNSEMKVTGVVSLGGKSSATVTQGKNKSGCPWKKQSTRSGLHVPLAKKSFDLKMQDKKEMKALRDRVKALREKRSEEKRAQHKRTKERAERKKINEMKSSSYQIVSTSSSCNFLDRQAGEN